MLFQAYFAQPQSYRCTLQTDLYAFWLSIFNIRDAITDNSEKRCLRDGRSRQCGPETTMTHIVVSGSIQAT